MWRSLATLLVLAAALTDATDRQARTFAFPHGKALDLELTIGTVRIEGWERDEAEVIVERHAPNASQFDRLPLVIEDTSSRLTVRAVQPDKANDKDLRADVAVRVPRTALIERAAIVEGRLSIANFIGSITGEVRRGPIDGKDVSGTIRLSSEIGSVTLSNARLVDGGLLRLRTFNGDVRVSLSERPANARIMALALNGNVKSEIPLTMRDRWGPRWAETTVGTGSAVMSLDVVTGGIEIKAP